MHEKTVVTVLGFKPDAEEVEECVYSYIEKLEISEPLTIDLVQVKDYIKNYSYESQLYYYDDNDNYFEINIDDTLKLGEIKKAIIHELIHIQQIVSGILVPLDDDNEKFMWYGEETLGSDYKEYEDRPWEVEAYLMEERL